MNEETNGHRELSALRVKMTITIVNEKTGKGYSLTAERPSFLDEQRDETAITLLDEILNMPITKEILEVENGNH